MQTHLRKLNCENPLNTTANWVMSNLITIQLVLRPSLALSLCDGGLNVIRIMSNLNCISAAKLVALNGQLIYMA